jgi:hypothetical protein
MADFYLWWVLKGCVWVFRGYVGSFVADYEAGRFRAKRTDVTN